jgi:hypothetical protein
MTEIVEQLLELETDKHRSLLRCDAHSYEATIRAQMNLLNDGHDLRAAAKQSPEKVIILSRLVRLNTALLVNFVLTSPLQLAPSEYTSAGALDIHSGSRFSVEI